MPNEKKSKATSNSQQETRVLLEQIHSEVKTVSEQHGSIMGKLQEHDQKFDKIDKRFDRVDARFDCVEGKMDRIENVITGVMSDHETRIKKLEEKVAVI